jgi:2-oxoglutarate ferredoxin oxidoreductase subunit beta
MTYIVMDNEVYGLTKGQPSPTTPAGMAALQSSASMLKMAPHAGILEAPLNIMGMVLAYGATFAARGFSGDPNQLADLFIRALNHRGFSFVQAMSPCPTFYNTYDPWREAVVPLHGHDPSDRVEALRIALTETQFHVGLFYQEERPPYPEAVQEMIDQVKMDREEALQKLMAAHA